MKEITIQYSLMGDYYEVVQWTEVALNHTTIEVLAKFDSEQQAKNYLMTV